MFFADVVNFPFLTVWKKDAPFTFTIFRQTVHSGRICGSDSFSYTGSLGHSTTP